MEFKKYFTVWMFFVNKYQCIVKMRWIVWFYHEQKGHVIIDFFLGYSAVDVMSTFEVRRES
jgi:hypothetical protein